MSPTWQGLAEALILIQIDNLTNEMLLVDEQKWLNVPSERPYSGC